MCHFSLMRKIFDNSKYNYPLKKTDSSTYIMNKKVISICNQQGKQIYINNIIKNI